MGEPLGLPDLDAGEYLASALFEVGPCTVTGMGDEIPITWEALWSYAQATGALTEPWEFRIVMDMSLAYVAGKRAGEDPFCRPPTDQDPLDQPFDGG